MNCICKSHQSQMPVSKRCPERCQDRKQLTCQRRCLPGDLHPEIPPGQMQEAPRLADKVSAVGHTDHGQAGQGPGRRLAPGASRPVSRPGAFLSPLPNERPRTWPAWGPGRGRVRGRGEVKWGDWRGWRGSSRENKSERAAGVAESARGLGWGMRPPARTVSR